MDTSNLLIKGQDPEVMEDVLLQSIKAIRDDILESISDQLAKNIRLQIKEEIGKNLEVMFHKEMSTRLEEQVTILTKQYEEKFVLVKELLSALANGPPLHVIIPPEAIQLEVKNLKLEQPLQVNVPPPRLVTKTLRYDDSGRPVEIREQEVG